MVANIFACMSPGLPQDWKKTWVVISGTDGAGTERKYESKFYFATLPSDVDGEELVPCSAEEITRRVTSLSESLPPERRRWRTATLVIDSEGEFNLKYDYAK